PTLIYKTVIEEEPLGTGGAIKAALQQAATDNVLIANGDTLFKISVMQLLTVHQANNAACTLALKPLQHFDRYGVVELDKEGCILSFKEKKYYDQGLINGGIYLVNKTAFLSKNLPEKFSFEKDYLETFTNEGLFNGVVQQGYFIDIGIPEDFEKAQVDLKRSVIEIKNIDKSWTLFLDRDGVINEESVGNYILHWNDFIFSKGVLEAWKILSAKFGTIIIVSNQRGVGKMKMTEDDLSHIHIEMQKEVEGVGGHIDKIYYCTDVDDKHFNRKPNPGMALQAVKDNPQIDLSKAIMVGNKPSDMRFGKAAGMYTVFLETTTPEMPFPHPDVDLRYPTLHHFALSLQP
ncbi:MAG TPA: HAD-IIIA family hydrolase, partial [Chitinophagaceae bacterium]|nr:HAD-IIIA family hydrolase [Chitinophagaceae bacterium]